VMFVFLNVLYMTVFVVYIMTFKWNNFHLVSKLATLWPWGCL
jgi:hypothetical protein